ncbi:hypothetical protein GF336_00085 [Candidatus Woesearchaeota archaeon]|nr:hypothetical protein [Candidatus Woesearchaeota archaeon]
MNILILFLEGFIANILTGADDTISHVPIAASLLKKRKGRAFFAFGMMFSVFVIIIIAILLSKIVYMIPYRNIISAALILALAFIVYFRKKKNSENRFLRNLPKEARLSALSMIGFLTVFATSIDDLVVYLSLMVRSFSEQIWVAAGIMAAGALEVYIVFRFSKYLSKFKYIKELTLAGLIVIAVLVGLKII